MKQLLRRLSLMPTAIKMRIAGVVVLVILLVYPYVQTVSGECRLAPGATQKVRAPASGRIEEVLVVEGQRVSKGDPVVRISGRHPSVVRAGIAGRVASVPLAAAAEVVAGQELLVIDEMRRATVEVLVPESEIGRVAIDQPVLVRMYADTGVLYEGAVQSISPAAERGPLGSVVVAKALIANADEKLVLGMTGVAKIHGPRQVGVVRIAKGIARFFK